MVAYHIHEAQRPDPEQLRADRAAQGGDRTVHGHLVLGEEDSPIYRLLGFLQEPDWKTLRTDGAAEFWAARWRGGSRAWPRPAGSIERATS